MELFLDELTETLRVTGDIEKKVEVLSSEISEAYEGISKKMSNISALLGKASDYWKNLEKYIIDPSVPIKPPSVASSFKNLQKAFQTVSFSEARPVGMYKKDLPSIVQQSHKEIEATINMLCLRGKLSKTYVEEYRKGLKKMGSSTNNSTALSGPISQQTPAFAATPGAPNSSSPPQMDPAIATRKIELFNLQWKTMDEFKKSVYWKVRDHVCGMSREFGRSMHEGCKEADQGWVSLFNNLGGPSGNIPNA